MARAAVRRGEFTPELYGFLGRLVSVAQATRAVAPSPGIGGRWNDPDAIQETVHAWLAEKLLTGGLLRAFDECLTPASLARYLERALRNWLASRSRAARGPRLLARAVRLLDSDPAFTLVRGASQATDRHWGLATWADPELFQGSETEIASASWGAGDFTIVSFTGSERNDPVLSSEDLRTYLLRLFDQLGAALSGRHLATSFRIRFPAAFSEEPANIDDVPEPAVSETPETVFGVVDAAQTALADLTERQLAVLLERPPATLEELARKFGTSRGTMDNEHRRALTKVKEAASPEQFRAVLEKLREMASVEPPNV